MIFFIRRNFFLLASCWNQRSNNHCRKVALQAVLMHTSNDNFSLVSTHCFSAFECDFTTGIKIGTFLTSLHR